MIKISLKWKQGKFVEHPCIKYKEFLIFGHYQNWFNNDAHVKRWAPLCYTRKNEEYGFFSKVPCLILRIGVDYAFIQNWISCFTNLQRNKKTKNS